MEKNGLACGQVVRILSTLEVGLDEYSKIERWSYSEGFDVYHHHPQMVMGESGIYSELRCRVLHPETMDIVSVAGDVTIALSISK